MPTAPGRGDPMGHGVFVFADASGEGRGFTAHLDPA
jgi:hypothetical protein